MRFLRITLIALTSAVSCVALDAHETVDTVINIQEVVVTGSNLPVQKNLLPYTVSVLGPGRLKSTGDTRVLSAISGMVPSLFVTQRNIFGFGVSNNGGSGAIKIRGVGNNGGVLMMVDGQPQFAGIYSHHIADFYDKEFVERVEVLRGPGSVLYGSNAMGGAINVISKSPADDGVKTTLSTQYGSYNTWLSSLSNTTRFGRFSSVLSASYSRTDGNVDNFDFKQVDVYAKVGYEFSEHWKSTVDYTFMSFLGNDPIYATLSNPESSDIYHQNVIRGEASLTVTNAYGPATGAARIYYSYGNHFIDDPKHFHSKDDRLGALLYQNFQPWQDCSATLGFDFDIYSGAIPMSGGRPVSASNLGALGRKTIVEYSPYVTISQSLLKELLNLNAGLRIANSDKFDTQAVPQFGFAINPGHGVIIKGNLAMGYRNPSFKELYLYRMANPDLNPEKMMNYELSVGKYFSQFFSVDLTAYFSQGKDMIQTVDQKNVNTDKFINKGIEVSANSHPLDNLHLYASYSYLYTSLDDLVGAPKNQYFLGAELRLWEKVDLSADLKGVGGLYVAETVKHQNYALLNLKVGYQLCKNFALFMRLENITDASYMINRGYEMPGFTVLGGFKVSL